jgi:predicted amidohydrolase
MKMALISFDPIWDDFDKSIVKCIDTVNRLEKLGAEICIFPESTLTGFSFSNLSEVKSIQDSESTRFFMQVASRLQANIIFGLFHKCYESNKVFNSAIVINNQGIVVSRYDKLHLFSPGGEEEVVSRGNSLALSEVGSVLIGLSICFDLRFPEMYSSMSGSCPLIINIANWPSQRSAHWVTLLRARSIENQAYFVGVNRYGYDGDGNFYCGDSMVFDPWGEIVEPKVIDKEISLYDLDLRKVDEIKSNFSIAKSRRFRSSLV